MGKGEFIPLPIFALIHGLKPLGPHQQEKIEMSNHNQDLSFFRKEFDLYPGAIVIMKLDGEGTILGGNKELLGLFECDNEEELHSLSKDSVIHVLNSTTFRHGATDISAFLESGVLDSDRVYLPLTTYKGKTITFRIFSKPAMLDGEKVAVVSLYRADLGDDSNEFDHLTGVLALHAFVKRGNEWLRQENGNFSSERFRIFYFNIRGFKSYNYAHGIDKGDLLLQNLSASLIFHFPNSLLSRYSDDHFVLLSKNNDYEERIKKVRRVIEQTNSGGSLLIQVGFYELPFDFFDVAAAMEKARLASESIHEELATQVTPYTSFLGKAREEKAYVIEHIDEAIANGWIKAYLQPIQRTINHEISSFECLARWQDPKKGMLLPKSFVPALEESKQIHKLDCYLLEKICKGFRKAVAEGAATFRVSFNLSRVDFLFCDMFAFVEKMVEEYHVPRELLTIEIAESAFVDSDDFIQGQIERFHKAGYRVWMDDFGSGYSYLTLLGKGNFDGLKIDMAFLKNFNDSSKSILTGIVRLAKELGISTIAEGVETKEQYDFLKAIGCEKVQGYYIGKPSKLFDALSALKEKGIRLEGRNYSEFYEKLGRIDMVSRKALCILELVDGFFHPLSYNRAFGEELSSIRIASGEQLAETLASRGSLLVAQWKGFAARVASSKTCESTYFTTNGRFIKLTAELIVSDKTRQGFLISIGSTEEEIERKEASSALEGLKNLILLYDEVYAIDTVSRTCHALLENRYNDFGNYAGNNARIQEYATNFVFPEDQLRFLSFANPTTFEKRVAQSEKGIISDYFRIKEIDGNYVWKNFTCMVLPNTDGKSALGVVSTVSFRSLGALNRGLGEENKLYAKGHFDWDAFMRETPIKMFYKDRNRRFLGASLSFLRYYGFPSVEEIIGKTDEEMYWHVAENKSRDVELDVIAEGKSFINVPGKCIVAGQIRNISASKAPLYENGQIVGLVGYFVDLDHEQEDLSKLRFDSHLDPLTNLLNADGILSSLNEYAAAKQSEGKPYALLLLEDPAYKDFAKGANLEKEEAIIKRVASTILDNVGSKGAVGHLYGCRYMVICNYEDPADVEKLGSDILSSCRAISEVEGKRVSVHLRKKIVYSDSASSEMEMIAMLFGAVPSAKSND